MSTNFVCTITTTFCIFCHRYFSAPLLIQNPTVRERWRYFVYTYSVSHTEGNYKFTIHRWGFTCTQNTYTYTVLREVLIGVEEDSGQLIHTNRLDKSYLDDGFREEEPSRVKTRTVLREEGSDTLTVRRESTKEYFQKCLVNVPLSHVPVRVECIEEYNCRNKGRLTWIFLTNPVCTFKGSQVVDSSLRHGIYRNLSFGTNQI